MDLVVPHHDLVLLEVELAVSVLVELGEEGVELLDGEFLSELLLEHYLDLILVEHAVPVLVELAEEGLVQVLLHDGAGLGVEPGSDARAAAAADDDQ